LQPFDSLLFKKSSTIPIGPNLRINSYYPFLFFSTLTMLPTLFDYIMGRAFLALLAGRALLNDIIASICFNYIAVEGRIPRLTGSEAKSKILGAAKKP
jgi:hypothetical protein